jgi:hypothetical protein
MIKSNDRSCIFEKGSLKRGLGISSLRWDGQEGQCERQISTHDFKHMDTVILRRSSTRWKGPMFQKQVRMHAWHLTSKHCTYIFFLSTGKSSQKSKKQKKNLTIRKFAEEKKKVQTLSSRKTHKF